GGHALERRTELLPRSRTAPVEGHASCPPPTRQMGFVHRTAAVLLARSVALVNPHASHASCGDHDLDLGELCDASGSGGDAACPERCVPSGLADACTCAMPSGEPRVLALGRIGAEPRNCDDGNDVHAGVC